MHINFVKGKTSWNPIFCHKSIISYICIHVFLLQRNVIMKYLIYILFFITISIQTDAVNILKKPYTYDRQNVKTYFGKDSLLGLEDKDGNKLTPAIYTEMGNISDEDMIMVEVDDSLYGMISTKGKIILPPIYSDIIRTLGYDPILIVEKDGKESKLKYNREKGIFDTVHTPKPKLSEIDSLKSIYEEVEIIGQWESWQSGGCAEYAHDKEINEFCSDCLEYGIRDTLAYRIKKDGKYYILSKDKKTIITEGKRHARSVYNIPFKYEQIDKEADLYIVKKDNRLGMISSKLKKVSRCKYENITFDETANYFLVENRFEKTGVYSSSGKKIIPVRYKDIDINRNANCLFVENRFDKTGVYSFSGKKIIPVRYEDIDFDGKANCFFVENRFDKTGVYSSSGKKIIPCKYKKIELIENEGKKYFKAKLSDNQYKYFSISGKEMPQMIHETITNP